MRLFAKILIAVVAVFSAMPAHAITNFQHIVVIFQENRTPDNLFWHLCDSNTCDPTGGNQNAYNIQTSNWLDNGGTINPQGVLLSNCAQDTGTLTNCWDPSHSHTAFLTQCHKRPDLTCYTDGANGNYGLCGGDGCGSGCASQMQFPFCYVDDGAIMRPYMYLASNYGWANYMFQTNQGPSFPAHQFIFGASSATSDSQDAAGYFASENMSCGTTVDGQSKCNAGCIAPSGTTVKIVDPNSQELTSTYPCFDPRTTISDLIETNSALTWTYYTGGEGSIWTAPNAISHICGGSHLTHCTASDFTNHVVLHDCGQNQRCVLSDAVTPNCNLASVNWVIPSGGGTSDHPASGSGGPDWVASIVNAIGNSQCTDTVNGQTYSYWQDTAIVITWDDWGGWYDHVSPRFLPYPEGGYQYGFRVPLIFVSAYGINNVNGNSACHASINNSALDFGSIARFIEGNFLGASSEGVLGLADHRSYSDLSGFYNLAQSSCNYVNVPAHRDAHWFMTHKQPETPPDTD